MLSIKYLRYCPEKVCQLPSELTIYRPWFKNAVGTRCVIGGPHKIFTEIESKYHINTTTSTSGQCKLFKAGYQVNPDVSLLHCKTEKNCFSHFMNTDEILEPSNEQIKVEQLHSSLFVKIYRFLKKLKMQVVKSPADVINIEAVKFTNSMSRLKSCALRKKLRKLFLISKSVSVDFKKRITTAVLPLMFNPLGKLIHNKCKALQVYNQQVKKLDMAPQDKQDLIESEAKLNSIGHVDFVKNILPAQHSLSNSCWHVANAYMIAKVESKIIVSCCQKFITIKIKL